MKKLNVNGFSNTVAGVLLLGFAATQTHAAPAVLNVSNPSFGSDTIFDQGVGDADPTVGSVVRLGGMGGWNVNVTTGISKPVLGSSTGALVDLNSINISSTGTTDTLTIEFWDFDFNGSGLRPFTTAIGGTLNNVGINWLACIDINNGTNCTDFLTSGADSSLSSSSFAMDDFDEVLLDASYSVGLRAQIFAIQSGVSASTSFDFEVEEVPLPAAAWLFGSGLLGLVGAARKKAKQTRS